MPVKFSNNAVSVTTTAMSSSDTALSLPSGHGAKFPALSAGDWCYLTLVDTGGNMEIVKATARTGDVLTVARAQEGTAARAFNIGAVVSHRLTAQAILDLVAGFATTAQLGDKADASALANYLTTSAKADSDKITFRQRGYAADFNTALDPGYYTFAPGAANQPPNSMYGHLLVVAPGGWAAVGNGLWLQQLAYCHDGMTFSRRCVNGGWTQWVPAHSEGVVISTAPPSGGYDGQIWYQV